MNNEMNAFTTSKQKDTSGGVYCVEKILAHTISGGTTYFLLKWTGYDNDHNSWEPIGNLRCTNLIEEYRASCHKKQLYNVEQVLDKREVNGTVEYLIKWQDRNNENNTWEPEDGLHCQELINKFLQNYNRGIMTDSHNRNDAENEVEQSFLQEVDDDSVVKNVEVISYGKKRTLSDRKPYTMIRVDYSKVLKDQTQQSEKSNQHNNKNLEGTSYERKRSLSDTKPYTMIRFNYSKVLADQTQRLDQHYNKNLEEASYGEKPTLSYNHCNKLIDADPRANKLRTLPVNVYKGRARILLASASRQIFISSTSCTHFGVTNGTNSCGPKMSQKGEFSSNEGNSPKKKKKRARFADPVKSVVYILPHDIQRDQKKTP